MLLLRHQAKTQSRTHLLSVNLCIIVPKCQRSVSKFMDLRTEHNTRNNPGESRPPKQTMKLYVRFTYESHCDFAPMSLPHHAERGRNAMRAS